MKKIIYLLFACIGSTMLICAKCVDDEPRYEGRWYVKNGTEQTLILIYPSFGHYVIDHMAYDQSIPSGDSILVHSSDFLIKDKAGPYFDRWLLEAVAKYGEDQSLKVLSGDSVLMKEWRYWNRDQPGRQFFKESTWDHYDVFINKDEFLILTDVWVFDIQPEDIAEPNP